MSRLPHDVLLSLVDEWGLTVLARCCRRWWQLMGGRHLCVTSAVPAEVSPWSLTCLVPEAGSPTRFSWMRLQRLDLTFTQTPSPTEIPLWASVLRSAAHGLRVLAVRIVGTPCPDADQLADLLLAVPAQVTSLTLSLVACGITGAHCRQSIAAALGSRPFRTGHGKGPHPAPDPSTFFIWISTATLWRGWEWRPSSPPSHRPSRW